MKSPNRGPLNETATGPAAPVAMHNNPTKRPPYSGICFVNPDSIQGADTVTHEAMITAGPSLESEECAPLALQKLIRRMPRIRDLPSGDEERKIVTDKTAPIC